MPSISPTVAVSSPFADAGVGTFANATEPRTLTYAAEKYPPLDLVAAQILQALALQNIIPPSTVNATPATNAPVSLELQLPQQNNVKPAAESDDNFAVNGEPQACRSSHVTDNSESQGSTTGKTTVNSD